MNLKIENLCLSLKILCLEIFKIFTGKKNLIFKRSYIVKHYIRLRQTIYQSTSANLLTPRLISVYKNRFVTRVNSMEIVVKSDGNKIFWKLDNPISTFP